MVHVTSAELKRQQLVGKLEGTRAQIARGMNIGKALLLSATMRIQSSPRRRMLPIAAVAILALASSSSFFFDAVCAEDTATETAADTTTSTNEEEEEEYYQASPNKDGDATPNSLNDKPEENWGYYYDPKVSTSYMRDVL